MSQVALTPEGMFLRKRADEIISMVDKTEAEFTSIKNSVSGDILLAEEKRRQSGRLRI